MAQAPSLWQDGVHSVGDAPRTQRTRKRSTRGGVFSWRLATWHPTRVQACGGCRHGNSCCMVVPWRLPKGAAPDAVTAARPVLNGGMRKRTHRQRALSLPNPAIGGA
jgi:hypothetical protein